MKESSKKLLVCLILTFCFMLAEYLAGIIFKSLSLLSDANHMLTDVSALVISWTALQLAKIPANSKKTFGYYRFEILASALNAALLLIIGIYILIQAVQRIYHPVTIHSIGTLLIASFGFIINLISVSLLHSHQHENLNYKSAYLESYSDLLSSLGVIIGAIFIYFTHINGMDTLIALLISLWIFPRAWLLLKESMNILLEAVPTHINYHQVNKDLLAFPGVMGIHDLHIWSLSTHQIHLTVHIHIDDKQNTFELNEELKEFLKRKYQINHTTFQFEKTICHR